MISRWVRPFSLSIAWSLCACHAPATAVNNQDKAVSGQSSASRQTERNIRVTFAFFRRSQVVLLMDGREIFNGPLDIISETNGGSGLIEVPMTLGPHTFRLTSGTVDTTIRVEITARTQVLFVNPVRPPFIQAMDNSPPLD